MIVTVIQRMTKTAIIEYDTDNGKYRSIVPVETLVETNGTTTHENPMCGVPYGVDWSLFGNPLSISAIDRAFRAEGIFTPSDLKLKSDSARRIITNLLGVNIKELYKFGISQTEGN